MYSQVGPKGPVTEMPKTVERMPVSPKLTSLEKTEGKLLF